MTLRPTEAIFDPGPKRFYLTRRPASLRIFGNSKAYRDGLPIINACCDQWSGQSAKLRYHLRSINRASTTQCWLSSTKTALRLVKFAERNVSTVASISSSGGRAGRRRRSATSATVCASSLSPPRVSRSQVKTGIIESTRIAPSDRDAPFQTAQPRSCAVPSAVAGAPRELRMPGDRNQGQLMYRRYPPRPLLGTRRAWFSLIRFCW
jgi:hypothetical protein